MSPVIDNAAIRALVEREYPLGTPSACVLLSEGINSAYRVDCPAESYVLRLQGEGKWWLKSEADLRFEIDLLTHLHDHDVPVSYPIPRNNGDALGRLRVADLDRDYSLFTWAPGDPPSAMTAEQAYTIGRTIAQIHVSADLFHTDLSRYELAEETLLDRPLRIMEPALQRADTGLATYIRTEIEKIRERMRAFDPGSDGWGIVHGDPQDLNYHLTPNGKITFFDFDLCGYGWRAYDVAYFYTRIPEPLRQPALDGYESLRPLSDAEHDMLPTFGRAAWIKERTMVGSGLPPHDLARCLEDPYES